MGDGRLDWKISGHRFVNELNVYVRYVYRKLKVFDCYKYFKTSCWQTLIRPSAAKTNDHTKLCTL